MKTKSKTYVADLETTSEYQYNIDGEVKVWGSVLIDIEDEEVKVLSPNIEDLLNYLAKYDSNTTSKKVYFHNLKFDGQFIINTLFKNGFTFSSERKLQDKQFSTIVSDDGLFYEIKICFKNYGTRSNQVVIHDSLKKLPFSVERIAKAFNLGTTKGTIDYNAYRNFPYTLTAEEEDYIVRDALIIARALKIQFSNGLKKMTIGSDALNDYKKIINKERYDYLFPELDLIIDNDLRSSYRGGWVYMNPTSASITYDKVLSFDVNSLYPYVMREKLLPYGIPKHYKGKYKKDDDYPLYIQLIRVEFNIKPEHVPTIQVKNNYRFVSTEYITKTDGEPLELFITSVDLQLLLEHYDIEYIEYVEGFKFRGITGLFNNYIDKWYAIKEKNTGAIREIAKLMLNNLYGKFGTNPVRKNMKPTYENGIVKWVLGGEETGKTSYIPMASFITSYAREKTIRMAQKMYPHFIYSDTDSIKLNNITLEECKKVMDIDGNKIGYWKYEGTAHLFKVLRAKTYITESEQGIVDITCSGLPKEARDKITFDEFRIGLEIDGKLQQKKVKGGVILKNTTYKIKENMKNTIKAINNIMEVKDDIL